MCLEKKKKEKEEKKLFFFLLKNHSSQQEMSWTSASIQTILLKQLSNLRGVAEGFEPCI